MISISAIICRIQATANSQLCPVEDKDAQFDLFLVLPVSVAGKILLRGCTVVMGACLKLRAPSSLGRYGHAFFSNIFTTDFDLENDMYDLPKHTTDPRRKMHVRAILLYL